MTNFIADLHARSLIQDIMPGTEEQLLSEVTSGYIGFDPTADSLHVGSLLPITLLMRLQRAGHKPVAVVGGATGMIGDPSGKSAERNLLDEETLAKNCAGIEAQLRKFLDFEGDNAAVLVNNYDWLKDYSFLHFIRDVGKHITISYMLSKESVQKRLETGLSFTEFSYQLIQGYDYYWLNKNMGVKLQMGGADQWGNILTGTELIRRINMAHSGNNPDSFGFTCPLITKSDGSKFGKSEGGNIWLDPSRTSPYQFYQFWLNLTDEDAARMMLIFSFREVAEINVLIEQHQEAPERRVLQKALAEELTTLVHSAEELKSAQQTTDKLFSNNLEGLKAITADEWHGIEHSMTHFTVENGMAETGFDLLSILAENNVFKSKGEARKMILAGGFYINKEKITDLGWKPRPEHLLNGKYLLLKKGKKDYTLAIFN